MLVADMAPAPDKAAALNAEELLRDPSHVRALTEAEFKVLFTKAGLTEPVITRCRWKAIWMTFFPVPSPSRQSGPIRQMFETSLSANALDLNTRRENDHILFSFPVRLS